MIHFLEITVQLERMFQFEVIGQMAPNSLINQRLMRFSGSFFLVATQMPLHGKTSGR